MLMRGKISMHVKTVVLLSQRKADDVIEVEIEQLNLITILHGPERSEDRRYQDKELM